MRQTNSHNEYLSGSKYASLRLAALEQFIDRGRPLPAPSDSFVAKDPPEYGTLISCTGHIVGYSKDFTGMKNVDLPANYPISTPAPSPKEVRFESKKSRKKRLNRK